MSARARPSSGAGCSLPRSRESGLSRNTVAPPCRAISAIASTEGPSYRIVFRPYRKAARACPGIDPQSSTGWIGAPGESAAAAAMTAPNHPGPADAAADGALRSRTGIPVSAAAAAAACACRRLWMVIAFRVSLSPAYRWRPRYPTCGSRSPIRYRTTKGYGRGCRRSPGSASGRTPSWPDCG